MTTSDLDFYGLNTNEWIGMILPYESQDDQIDGDAGFGYRYRVAIMGNHPSDNSIKDEDIVFATTALGVSDGTGAGNRQRKPALSQGDVVMGKFLDGNRKQNPVITNSLGRTAGIKYGRGRFESKTGFVGSTKENNLLKRQETSEADGICSPKAISPSKSNRKSPLEQLKKSGIPLEATVGAIPKPQKLDSLINEASGQFSQAIDEATGQLNQTVDAVSGQISDATDQLSDFLGNS